ncbi:hypothetical protein AXF42_Ash003219 [Apostasia shenzhenica]|uniref:Magnesium transporter CorA-like family protein n=1 Tax=Apostasia shenzhenica TaxID=1088818 RepID=A0A2I0BFI5_9ASPA|nr:hypothetical protein AXF42_Ash003219 [Apostasia shenzhenica]
MSSREDHQNCSRNKFNKQDAPKFHSSRDGALFSDLWTDGLICAFEFIRGNRWKAVEKHSAKALFSCQKDSPRRQAARNVESNVPGQILNDDTLLESRSLTELDNKSPGMAFDVPHFDGHKENDRNSSQVVDSHWVPIGWARISELVQMIQVDAKWSSQLIELSEDENDFTVAGVVAPYWERPEGPTWWCHVSAGHPFVGSWLGNAHWLHPAICVALRDESRLISERMKYLLYEVPVRVAGGLLFELLGQSVGDPFCDEDDIPIVLRSWQAQHFLVTAMHVKGTASSVNVIGITEVQELLLAGGSTAPKSVHEIIAHLACRLSRWDDRLFRKFVFGAADEIELKFVNRRSHEDLNLLSIILNQEIRRLATQVIRVKWSLHAREEIVFELLQHLRGTITRSLLEGIRKGTREMLEEQEAVRGRLFTIQDVLQSTVRAWLQDQSLRITHNLAIFGGCGLVLSIITGLFGINVDGIPGAHNTPYAFGLFAAILFFAGIILIGLGMLYLGLKKPITEEQVHVRKRELQQLVSMFQHDAETHAKVRDDLSRRHNLPPTAADLLSNADYLLIT